MTIPDPHQAIAMPVEELAGYLVMHHKGHRHFNVHNEMCGVDSPSGSSSLRDYFAGDFQLKEQYKEALIEAYSWAYTEGLFIPDPNQITGNWWKVSRRGRQLTTHLDVLKLAARDILPKSFLHPLILEYSAPIFHMGRYDAAVFQAFKQVEIAVRDATGLTLDGASLMKTAFNADKSKTHLNTASEPSEREGLMFIFAGAIQLFRNSTGHKNIELDPKEAAHLLIHASYLLNLLEKHVEAAKGLTAPATAMAVPVP